MTIPISDEQLEELEGYSQHPAFLGDEDSAITMGELRGLIARLRAAEADVERLNKLDALCEAYGFEGIHEGNRWMIDGPYRDIRAAIDGIKPAMDRTP
ncbi:TPA: hypothetical protein QBQ37_005109 [Pseudomonas aeruginosa]|uniref:hypothetical protein n=1 Tax=Pseudomonas aeruginosa TaxID=287 RepID=UPI00053E3DD4|nr:hypothetical protein [Pseudomonas aeruginosa]AOT41167.1 hypothetical protein BHE76_29585 [Pseudomonas aeruginosa]AXC23646.1 hypothetical protein CWE28_27835 [Pseudomonas aeruginosa]EKU2273753.1 hypothetical protein [Pseudomonas aeruginosa]EKX7256961.1 hypothetical protein [Pseudomonas aeruginosa]ELO0933412.1 hypothetical protein [Pseudomonas aeruginosa]